ncbi:MAG TPA: glycoside hydrolase family 43 protein [Bacteroidales bacterium]|jgi:GH43 family beta-xylosidase|nr:glycoside hydrolase family 43 protein [Bacteroidales bacterium]
MILFFFALLIPLSGLLTDTLPATQIQETFTNPVYNGADPWIVKKKPYYYYCFSSGNSISISKSLFLTKRGETKKVWSLPKSGWNRSNLWAPELHFIDGRWYIYYAAGISGPPYIHQRTGVLMSETDDPFDGFKDMGMIYTGDNPDMRSDNKWAIDMTVFRYKKKLYAVWSGWMENASTDKTPQHLFIAEMESPVKMKSPRTKISSPDQQWETGGPLDLQEGPAILMRGKNLFIVYSCRESWRVDYRLGLLRLNNRKGSLLSAGNWMKKGPVFTGPYGVGHCSFSKSPDEKEDWIIYHSKRDSAEGWSREVRMQPFHWYPDGFPEFGSPVPSGVQIPRPSGETKLEKHVVIPVTE